MGRRTRWWRERGVMAGGVAAGTLIAVFSTVGAWGSAPPAGEDVMAHLVRLDFGVSELVAHGRLDGWFPRFYLGYQEFLFNGPGLAWAVAALRALSAGSLSNDGALKVVGILSLAALPLAVAFTARSLGLGRRASGLAAALTLLVSNVFGVGLQGVYVVGLVPHQIGAIFFFLALGALVRVLVDDRIRWVVLAALSLAALAITHLISVTILAVFFPLFAMAALRQRLRLVAGARLLATGALAAGLAAWWLVPLLAHRDLRGVVATWVTPPFGDRVDEIVDGRLLLRPHAALLLLAGWVAALLRVRRHRPFAVAVVVVPPAYVVLAHWFASRWPDNELTVQFANRGLGYAGVLAVLPLAAAGAELTRFVTRVSTRSWGPAVADAGAVLVASVIVVSPLGPDRAVASEFPDAIEQMSAAAAELRRTVPDGARFAAQQDFPNEILRTNVLHPDTWLTRRSGRNSLNGFNLEATSTPAVIVEFSLLAVRPPEESADALARLGVTHVVTTDEALALRLSASDRFRATWSASPLTLFEVRPAPGQPVPASLLATEGSASARLVRAEPEHLAIETTAAAATDATVAVAWSPKWHGEVDGEPVDLRRAADGLIAVRLPEGRSVLELTYEPDAWDRTGTAISLMTLLSLVACAVLLARRRRSAATKGVPGEDRRPGPTPAL